MKPMFWRRVLLVGVGFAIGASLLEGAQQGARLPWWKNDQVVKELGLTPDQADRIDQIFQGTRPELRQELDELERLERKLSHLIQTDADEAVVVRWIDKVETARAALSKTRSVMYLRMRQIMTADQRGRFTALQRRWEEEARARGAAPLNRPDKGAPKREN
jgi:Spy/CpxP family protein refolding chaperone